MEDFLSGAIFTVIIEALGKDVTLGYLIKLTNSISNDAISGSWKLGMRRVVDVVQVVHNKLHLILMVNGCSEGLEYKLFDLQGFSI